MPLRGVASVLAVMPSACGETTPEQTEYSVDPHQGGVEIDSARLPAPAAAPASVGAVGKQVQQRLRSVAHSGTIDHDVAMLLLEQYRGTQQLAGAELAAGRDSSLRTLAHALNREWQRESQTLKQLVQRTHTAPSAVYDRQYQAFSREVQAAWDSASVPPPRSTGDPDADFAGALAAHLRTGLLLVREGIAHGTDSSLIALAHRFHHDQRQHLRQVQAWSQARTVYPKP